MNTLALNRTLQEISLGVAWSFALATGAIAIDSEATMGNGHVPGAPSEAQDKTSGVLSSPGQGFLTASIIACGEAVCDFPAQPSRAGFLACQLF
jgi:hypothetical protein